MNITKIETWEQVKDSIRFKVLNKKDAPVNTSEPIEIDGRLVKAPTFLEAEQIANTDIVKVYVADVEVNGDVGAMLLTDQLLDFWNVSIDDVRTVAEMNLERDILLMRMAGTPLLVITSTEVKTRERVDGAANAFTNKAKELIRISFGEKAVLFPSSKEEIIVAPYYDGCEETYNQMVAAVNKTIDADLILSDVPLLFDNGMFTALVA